MKHCHLCKNEFTDISWGYKGMTFCSLICMTYFQFPTMEKYLESLAIHEQQN